jgi:hypothetical protein
MAAYGINTQEVDAQNAMNQARNAQYEARNKELNDPAYLQAQYNATYGSPKEDKARAASRADAQMASDLRMKESGGSQKDIAIAVQKPQLEAEKYKVDATTGAEVKVAGLNVDASKYMADVSAGSARYAADTNYKGQELQAGTARYGMDKQYDLGSRELADKGTQRTWQSGENRADRALQSSLLGFQTSLAMIQGGRSAQTQNYWK